MKKKFILLPLVGLLFYVALTGAALGPGLEGDGDRTGASGGIVGCLGSGCHAPAATASTTISIQLYDATGTTLITGGYVGGTAYTIRVTGVNTGATLLPEFGFQLAIVKSGTTTAAGSLTAITGTHKGTYSGVVGIVEHSSPIAATTLVGGGGAGTTYLLNIPWTAPVAGTGTVKVFTIINAVDANGSADAGDLWNNATLPITELIVASPITGVTPLCVGTTASLSDATAGGTWSSSATGIATIGSGGTVTGVAGGTATITYDAGASGTATTTVTVGVKPTVAAIAGASLVCIGTHIILSDATTGGVWTSTTSAIATAGSSTGIVMGIALGVDTIKYTITNSCGTAGISHTVTVKALGGTCVSGVSAIGNPLQTELKVYPNPNQGAFTMNLLSENDEQATIIITNIVGEKVKEFSTATNKELEISLTRVTGIYFVTAATAHGVFVARVAVQ